jgi:DNA-binding NtrC family response regulator
VVATNQELKKLVQDGRFRSDLYYRLKVHQLEIPPLRNRLEDIPLLLEHFLGQAAAEFNKKKPTPPSELAVLLQTYHFPGNVRELQSMVYDAVSQHHQRKMSMDVFKKAMGRTGDAEELDTGEEVPAVQFGEQLPTLKQTVRQLLMEAMQRTQGNQTMMATMLGISRPALSKRLKNLREEDEE